jgi:hypothetical protein
MPYLQGFDRECAVPRDIAVLPLKNANKGRKFLCFWVQRDAFFPAFLARESFYPSIDLIFVSSRPASCALCVTVL